MICTKHKNKIQQKKPERLKYLVTHFILVFILNIIKISDKIGLSCDIKILLPNCVDIKMLNIFNLLF